MLYLSTHFYTYPTEVTSEFSLVKRGCKWEMFENLQKELLLTEPTCQEAVSSVSPGLDWFLLGHSTGAEQNTSWIAFTISETEVSLFLRRNTLCLHESWWGLGLSLVHFVLLKTTEWLEAGCSFGAWREWGLVLKSWLVSNACCGPGQVLW